MPDTQFYIDQNTSKQERKQQKRLDDTAKYNAGIVEGKRQVSHRQELLLAIESMLKNSTYEDWVADSDGKYKKLKFLTFKGMEILNVNYKKLSYTDLLNFYNFIV